MLGVEVPTEYILVILGALVSASLGFIAWIVKNMGEQQVITAALGERINAQHELLISQHETILEQNRTMREYDVRLRLVEHKVA